MTKSQVCLLYVTEYNESSVYSAVKKGFEFLGGIEKFVGKNERILLKPNLLVGAAPEKAVTTHPSVFGAVIRCLKESGADRITYGDSSGIGATSFDKVAVTSGLEPISKKYGIKQGEFNKAVTVDFPEGKVAKKFNLASDVLEADCLFSLSKMKTHALENITGALKNQYGCIYGSNKGIGHAKYPSSQKFADMIADLNRYLKPRFFIMDGILAMEGNGPGSGDPVYMNVILMSADPVALDTVFSRLIYLAPEAVPTTVSGYNAGLGTMLDEEIEVLTEEGIMTTFEAQAKYGNPDFNVKRSKPNFWKVSAALQSTLMQFERPVVDKSECIGCGICEEACPVDGKAVHSGNGLKAKYDYKKCIRCYCCQEMCPKKAIRKRYF